MSISSSDREQLEKVHQYILSKFKEEIIRYELSENKYTYVSNFDLFPYVYSYTIQYNCLDVLVSV